ncbi:MAG: cupin domain-containing protein [Nitrospirae bacterium]|nr:cupin domain-containing protein [Nitrospirota bacterium]MEC4669177.1 cupin domain-containing protein [Nitrospirota bacterium]
MLVTRLKECHEFLAGDHTNLRELLRPVETEVDIRYSLAHGRLEPGTCSKRHRLASSEVYYFLSGEGVFRIGEESATVEAGAVVYVPPRSVQWLENTGTSVIEFLCLVDPPWRPEDEVVLE